MVRDIMAAVRERVLVCEGAMGTALAARGVTLRNSGEANLTHPEIVGDIHRSYKQAGAQVFQTNTFAANLHMLQRVGLAKEATEIWSSSVRICREAVGAEAFVCANGGPSGGLMAPLGELGEDDIRANIRQQFEVMLGPEIDFVLLESFEALEEAEAAVGAVRELDSQIPVAVTISFSSPGGRTSMGVDGATAAARLSEQNVQIIGASCGEPSSLEIAFREMAEATDRALMAQANAGVPELRDGKTVFGGTPAEAGEQAARLIAYGARIIGGCCGSTPDHIAQIVRAASADA